MRGKSNATDLEPLNITITGRHVAVTDAMKDYATDKVSKMERFTNRIIDINVIMDITKIEHKVVTIMKFNHFKIKTQATSNDMYASIDIAVNKLEAILRKYKSRLQDHQAKGLSVVDMNVNVFQRPVDELEDLNAEIEEENNRELEKNYRAHNIVKSETRPLKILTNEEAIMKMELSGDLFLIFKNEEDRKFKVIYRRYDGNFGIIEPE